MNQAYQGRLSNFLQNGVTSETQTLDFTNNFSGGGLLVDFQVDKPLRQSRLSFFSNARAAVLVGQTTQRIGHTQTVNDSNGLTNGGAFPVATFINPSSYNLMPIVELELGLQYTHNRMFFRSAAVNQTYFGAGNAASSNWNLDLFGLQVSTGVV